MWTLDAFGRPPLWRPDARGAARHSTAFTTRRGGVSAPPFDSLNTGRSTDDDPAAVAENRRRVLAALGLDRRRLATAGQVHGANVAVVEEPGHVPRCDALVTRRPGLALAVTTADCLPIVFLAPGLVGVAHSGWRGTAAGIPAATLARLVELGAAPGAVTAHIGPAIRACCYEVGGEVAERFPAACVTPAGDRFRLDLALAARLELERAGLAGRVHDLGECTACRADRYFSYRRDGPRSGRAWAVAAVAETGASIAASGGGV